MEMRNEMELIFDSLSQNEGFARVAVSAFVAPLNPTMDEITDLKTAVSEAVTNCIIHGYEKSQGKVYLTCRIQGQSVELMVEDQGCGIPNVEKAMQPFYTTRPQEERSGMGFAFMEAFMDEVKVESSLGKGTRVFMKKTLGTEVG